MKKFKKAIALMLSMMAVLVSVGYTACDSAQAEGEFDYNAYLQAMGYNATAQVITLDNVVVPAVDHPYYIKVNRRQNVITVYTLDEYGQYTVPVRAMLCSTGAANSTPCGIYHTSTKYVWKELNGKVYGQYDTRFATHMLFHSVPYSRNGDKGSLITRYYNKLGSQASGGCIRLAVENSKWIYDNIPSGTTVEIYDSSDPGPLGKPAATRIVTTSACAGWDPTDPDPSSPWNYPGVRETETYTE